MAHFAELDQNNIVLRVIVINNEDILDTDGNESEQVGIAFCQSFFGSDTNWVQTSYNDNFRKHYAGIGYAFDSTRDAFILPQPYPSWILNEDTCEWEAPVPYPDVENAYIWNEVTLSWQIVS
jgi:hypothetical protein